MSLTLKRDPEWMGTLQQADVDQALALLIGENGCQVSVPVAILVAASPLLRSISAVLLPPAISPVALSVPGVAGDVLSIVVEMMTKGTSYDLNSEQIQKVYEVFEVLGFAAVLNSYNLDYCDIKIEVKYEKAIDAFEKGEVGVTSTKDSNLEEKSNFSVIEKDNKVELNSKCEKIKSMSLHDRKAKRKIHTSERIFACDQCDYKVCIKSTLIRHKRTHTGKKLYECDQCDFKSAHRSKLQKHKKIHTSEKPFACDQCKYKGNDIYRLRRHLKIHTGEKPFACNQCEYRANQYSSLIRHRKIHTCEEPYDCDQCDYKCSVSTRFLRHMKVKHKVEKPFKCDLCDYKAKKWRELIDHKRIHE